VNSNTSVLDDSTTMHPTPARPPVTTSAGGVKTKATPELKGIIDTDIRMTATILVDEV
jgi:hypothetical protein